MSINRIFSFFAFFLTSILLNAQILPGKFATGKGLPPGVTPAPVKPLKSGTVFWSNDFSNAADWTYLADTNEWYIGDTLPSGLVGQGFDATINSASGAPFAYIDSDGPGQGHTQNAFLILNDPVDCSQFAHVKLEFENYFRQYQEKRWVFISTDSVTWDSIQVFANWPSGTTSGNPVTASIDISALAGGQDSVYLKFKYEGNWDWFWAIDDIRFVEPPASELTLQKVYYQGAGYEIGSRYYTNVPIRHALKDTLAIAATFTNTGINDQTGIKLYYTFKRNGTNLISSATTPIDLTANQTGTGVSPLHWNAVFTGDYAIDYQLKSDSIPSPTPENKGTTEWHVGLNLFARDNDSVDLGQWLISQNGIWEMLVAYDFKEVDTVFGISVYFPDLTNGYGLKKDDRIEYLVYKESDLVNPVVISDPHFVEEGQSNDWLAIGMPPVTLSPDRYYIGFRVYNDSIAVGTNTELNKNIPPYMVLGRTDVNSATDPWFYTSAFLPFIRVYTGNEFICDSTDIVINETVFDNQTIGKIELEITGGTPPYTFVWSSSSDTGYFSSKQNPDDIMLKGDYTVVVTDLYGCSASKTVTVAGIVSTGKTIPGDNFTVRIFPNPNRGEIRISGLPESKNGYEALLYNTAGQAVLHKRLISNNNNEITLNTSQLEKGIYILEIRKSGLSFYRQITVKLD